jgi:hypothetical protein
MSASVAVQRSTAKLSVLIMSAFLANMDTSPDTLNAVQRRISHRNFCKKMPILKNNKPFYLIEILSPATCSFKKKIRLRKCID